MEKSSQFQIDAFRKQFPALSAKDEAGHSWLGARVQSVRVARVNPELMEYRPRCWEVQHRNGDHSQERADLFDAEWRHLGEARPQHESGGRQDGAPGESVGEAIARLDCAAAVARILVRRWGYTTDFGTTETWDEATVYLAPKGWSVAAWVTEQRRRAEAQIAAEVAAIDDEPTR